jgi:N-hydroxyarylamine O-acetyltransferase
MDAQAYLQRIGYQGSLAVNRTTLEALARAHLESVPFENFDIHLGRPLHLHADHLFHKIVVRRRGGFCYELNGLFALLLRELGFEVELLSARVFRKGKSGQEFDHMALRVRDGRGEYLVDVGFGDASTLPIELCHGATREDRGNRYHLYRSKRGMLFEMESAGFSKGYELSLDSQQTGDFRAMCLHHQTSARSWFTQARICVLMTESGTRSLIEGVFTDGEGSREVHDPGQALTLLREQFGLDLPRMPENKSARLPLRVQKQALAWESRVRKVWSLATRLAV